MAGALGQFVGAVIGTGLIGALFALILRKLFRLPKRPSYIIGLALLFTAFGQHMTPGFISWLGPSS